MNKPKAVKVDFKIPVKTISEMNAREHWVARHIRKKSQQEEVLVGMHNNLRGRQMQLPCAVQFTRIGPRKLDDDNLRGSMKFIRDAVAHYLGVDDGSDLVEWRYAQMPVGIREYAVKIQIESLGD